jgi:trk system potassium uptake protein TrkH
MLICATNSSLSANGAIFEATSAIGTVGLSTGITNSLNTFAQMILVLLMYAGRVGSVSFAILFREHRVPPPVQSPAEKINIG